VEDGRGDICIRDDRGPCEHVFLRCRDMGNCSGKKKKNGGQRAKCLLALKETLLKRSEVGERKEGIDSC